MSLALPIAFTYTAPVFGKGFLADIELSGRVLAVQETAGVWLYGVNPGALAVAAQTLSDANRSLSETLTKTFIDFALEADSFEAFKVEVEKFFHTTDADADDWYRAIEDVKAGRVPIPDDLPRRPNAEAYIHIVSKLLNEVTPRDNPLVRRESQPEVAAVA